MLPKDVTIQDMLPRDVTMQEYHVSERYHLEVIGFFDVFWPSYLLQPFPIQGRTSQGRDLLSQLLFKSLPHTWTARRRNWKHRQRRNQSPPSNLNRVDSSLLTSMWWQPGPKKRRSFLANVLAIPRTQYSAKLSFSSDTVAGTQHMASIHCSTFSVLQPYEKQDQLRCYLEMLPRHVTINRHVT